MMLRLETLRDNRFYRKVSTMLVIIISLLISLILVIITPGISEHPGQNCTHGFVGTLHD